MVSVTDLRREYMTGGLSEQDAGDDPFALFHAWLNAVLATDLPEPNAMTLATSTPDGVPSARMVLLKGVDDGGFVFYTNYESRKGHDLTANPNASVVFPWFSMWRQVTAFGSVVWSHV